VPLKHGTPDQSGLLDALRRDLAALESRHLRRTLRAVERAEGARIVVDGRELVNFASNDYLGLARHPKVRAAAASAALEWGWGAASSRLLSGTTALHAGLERRLAAFRGAAAALVFPSGYAANLGLLQALADEHSVIAADALNHASLIDACRLTKARVVVYSHRDAGAARLALAAARDAPRRFLLTDSVLSMDGDLAPLPELLAVARETGSVLVVDDAHGNGVLGPRGRGALEHFRIDGPEVIVTATLSKAFGGMGGFVSGAAEVVEWLVSKARTFVYTTAPPPAACAAALAALEVMEAEPGRRERVRANARRLREALRALDPERFRWPPEGRDVPIVPVIVGSADRALAAAAALFERGFYAPAIRPPTVPEGTARLRISLTADHTDADVDALAAALGAALKA
jgi:8-amino-7-oxononanoate synthase